MSGTLDDYINYRISKSKETFRDAQLLYENGRCNSAVNRLYYSTYYLVSALLSTKGINATSHSGVRTLFNLHFIKSQLVSKEFGKLYRNLFEWRQKTDYADFIDFEKNFVKELLNEVKLFNSTLLNLLFGYK